MGGLGLSGLSTQSQRVILPRRCRASLWAGQNLPPLGKLQKTLALAEGDPEPLVPKGSLGIPTKLGYSSTFSSPACPAGCGLCWEIPYPLLSLTMGGAQGPAFPLGSLKDMPRVVHLVLRQEETSTTARQGSLSVSPMEFSGSSSFPWALEGL